METKKTVSDSELQVAYQNEDYRNIIESVCQKYRKQLDAEQRKSCGMIALWNTMVYHDDSRSKFTTLLYLLTNRLCAAEASGSLAEVLMDNLDLDKIEKERPAFSDFYDCIDKLSADDRDYLLARFRDGLTVKELSERTRCSRENVRKRLNVCKQRLREIINNDSPRTHDS